MNTFSYKHGNGEDSGTFLAVIDGKDTFFGIDVAALDVSRTEGGVCPILFCANDGMIGCAGYYAHVSIDGNEIVWDYFYDRFYEPDAPEEYKTMDAKLFSDYADSSKDFVVKAPLRFDKSKYVEVVEKLLGEIKNYPAETEEYERAIKDYRSGDRFRG